MVAISIPQPEPAEWSPAPGGAPAPRRPEHRPRPVAPSPRPALDRATRYRRRRLAALVLVTLTMIVGAALTQAVSSALAPSGGPAGPGGERVVAERPPVIEGDVYVVQPGDTLWTIAAALAPDADPRAVVDELRRVNGGSALQVGDRLRVDSDGLG